MKNSKLTNPGENRGILQRQKKYDLEERTFLFASKVRALTKQLYHSIENIEDIKQLVRSSGSVGANYIEANESLSKKDFLMRIKICRKEAKEIGLPTQRLLFASC